MVVWGGAHIPAVSLNTGGRYDPDSDAWAATSTTGAPNARSSHTAIWTGREMIVWGGANVTEFNSGGRYDPVSDTWTPVSTLGAPSARHLHTAVWTGSLMIVWGGFQGTPLAMYLDTGGRYDPMLDRWTPTTLTNVPAPRDGHKAVWTGTLMIIWGGSLPSSGGRYDPGQPEVDSDHDGWTACEGDCNDADPAVHPGAAEICNGIDDNCNGLVDEGFDIGYTCTVTLDGCHQVVGAWECLSSGAGRHCVGSVRSHDVTPPEIVCPPGAISECPAQPILGQAIATDECDPSPRITNNAPTPFPLGTIVLTFRAVDASGNASICNSSGTMEDTVPPLLALPSSLATDATMPAGVPLAYAATAADACAGAIAPVCSPPSDSIFPINAPGQFTTVACEAGDPSGNRAAGSFPVHVKGAEEQLNDLGRLILASGLPKALASEFGEKIREALKSISEGGVGDLCHTLEQFDKQVLHESTKKMPGISADLATDLLDASTRIRAVLGCVSSLPKSVLGSSDKSVE
jgi:hypothetical protein